MKRDLDSAISFLFPASRGAIKALLLPLPNDRVRWAVLACSRGSEVEFHHYLNAALTDWRDVLQSESMSDDPKGPGLRALPRPEELAFNLHAHDLGRLAFFDRIVWSGAAAFDPPQDFGAIVRMLTERVAPHYGPAPWAAVPFERSRFLLRHVMCRSFTNAEIMRAPELLSEFESFAPVERTFLSCDPDPPPILSDGRPDRSHGRLNYRIGVVLLGKARAWGLWMVHDAG